MPEKGQENYRLKAGVLGKDSPVN